MVVLPGWKLLSLSVAGGGIPVGCPFDRSLGHATFSARATCTETDLRTEVFLVLGLVIENVIFKLAQLRPFSR